MTAQNILNVSGLVIGMAGSYIMFHFSSKVSSQVVLYQREEAEQLRKKDDFKNKMIRFGMLLLFIGFTIQLAALLL